ncbi:ABC transporter permease subunit, partial [Salmonella enterica]|uniref:ABC transporter permease subunit n=1 Tax=Salmonella enterica TaxID=28901 RepID=UPI0012FE1D98
SLGWFAPFFSARCPPSLFPSLPLGAAVASPLARFSRSPFFAVPRADYLRPPRAPRVRAPRGVLPPRPRHALIPVVTMVGLQFGLWLGGSIVDEKVLNWPGLGRLLGDSVDMRDYPVIQAEVLLLSLEFILINLVVNVLYAAINPAIRCK